MARRFIIQTMPTAFLLAISYTASPQEGGGILMPPPPFIVAPPATNDDGETQLQEDLQKKRERRRQLRNPKSRATEEREKRQKFLERESIAPRLRAAYFDVSLVLVQAATKKKRSNFISNPTSHFNFLWRQNAGQSDGKTGTFYGFRLAPFSGSGRSSGIPGSFGYTYFGPAIGIGKFGLFPADYGHPASDPSAENGRPALPVTPGWIVSAGIAAQSRVGRADSEDGRTVKEDFVSKGLDFDDPGLWMEGRILRIHYGATGYSTVFGVQTGRSKLFFYVGVAGIALY